MILNAVLLFMFYAIYIVNVATAFVCGMTGIFSFMRRLCIFDAREEIKKCQ